MSVPVVSRGRVNLDTSACTAWISWRRIRSRSAVRCAGNSSSHTATCAANSLSAMVSCSQREKSPRSRWYCSARGSQMPYRGAEIAHSACRRDGLAVDRPKVEPPLLGQRDVGIFVTVPHVGRAALGDGEREAPRRRTAHWPAGAFVRRHLLRCRDCRFPAPRRCRRSPWRAVPPARTMTTRSRRDVSSALLRDCRAGGPRR